MRPILLITLLFTLALSPNDARKANEAYERGAFEEAIELYRQAIVTDPENTRLHFNLGNSLARAGYPEDAIQAYEKFKSLSEDPLHKALADYNIGNLYSEHEQFDQAIEHYRESLRNNPNDEDTKHNYELALKQKEESDPQNQERPDHPETDREDDEEGGDQSQDSPEPDLEGDQEDQEDGSSQPQPDMSLEEAESVLDALQQRERELLQDRQKTADEEERYEKDW